MRYTPASGTEEIKRAFSLALERDHGLVYAPEQIAVTSGTKLMLYALLNVLTDPGDKVLIPAPFYTSYYHAARLAGTVPVVIPCGRDTGYRLTEDLLETYAKRGASVLILNNPCNPSGVVYTREELTAFAKLCEKYDLWVVTDEIYGALTYTEMPFVPFASVGDDAFGRTVTVNGVSKAYAMTGWRIGCAAGPVEVIKPLKAMLSHTAGSPNTAAQTAAAAALREGNACPKRIQESFRRRRDIAVRELSGINGLTFPYPEGAFYIMPDISPWLSPRVPDDGAFALGLLREKGVAVVPCADYGAPGCIRIAFTASEDELVAGLQGLKEFLAEQN